MVFQRLISLSKDETTAFVRSRRGNTYNANITENVPTERARTALERGWEVDANIRFYDKRRMHCRIPK